MAPRSPEYPLAQPLLADSYTPDSPIRAPTPLAPGSPTKRRSRNWIIKYCWGSRLGRIITSLALLTTVVAFLHTIFQPDYSASVERVYDWVQLEWPSSSTLDSNDAPSRDGSPFMGSAPLSNVSYGAHVEGHEWTIEDLEEMVAETKGYYVRDWSLGLGWNNMRYIIEASLFHAKLLNRTLVLPSFVYARGCEFAHEVCAAYAPQVDRFKAVGWERDLDPEVRKREDGQVDHTGWRVPIEYLLDLPNLRSSQPVLLISEYLTMHGLDPSLEGPSGRWERTAYHSCIPQPSFSVIPNSRYDPSSILRVDKLLPSMRTEWTEEGYVIQARLQENKGTVDLGLMEWDEVKDILRDIEGLDVDDDEQFVTALQGAGLQVLYTFQGSRGIDLIKHVTDPLRQIAPVSMLRGLYEDYSEVSEEVLLLEGETHLFRKPGALRFTTEAARQDFESIVLLSLRPSERVREVGNRVAKRMSDRVGGRMWLAGHLRRGDFVELGWALEHDIDKHLKIMTDAFERARETLAQIKEAGDAHIAPVPGTKLYEEIWQLELPQSGDPFFLATDERDPSNLAYCRSQGALLSPDIIDYSDRRLYGWELLFSDIVMLVEQVIMSNAGFFYGYGASSVAGGTLNQRAARGMDPRTGVVE